MANTLIFDMPVEFRLELMAVVGSDFPDAEREILDDVVDKVDGAGLSVFLVDLERTNTRGVIDSSELKRANFLTVFSFESQELKVQLNVVVWNLFVVALRVDLAQARTAR